MIAVVYTTHWDNYLVATRVWWYDPALVSGIGVINYVRNWSVSAALILEQGA